MELTRDDLLENPITLFGRWFTEAQAVMAQPEALCLATNDEQGNPDARMVLLKIFDEDGFVFFTNYESEKARGLAKHTGAAMVFYWEPLQRQVRVRGKVKKVSDAISDTYFHSRPRISRIGAWASQQSRQLQSREELEQRVNMFEEKYPDDTIPRPDHWGGFRLIPSSIEFWQEKPFRLHDRFLYSRTETGWEVVRLFP